MSANNSGRDHERASRGQADQRIRVRRLTPGDIDWLWTLDWSPLVKERDTFYLLALGMQGRWAYIAETDGKPAGVLLASADDSERLLYVNHLLVFEPHRGAGVGTTLMDRLEAEAREAGIRRVWLMTTHTRRFYERRGYRVSTDVLARPLQRFLDEVKHTRSLVKDL